MRFREFLSESELTYEEIERKVEAIKSHIKHNPFNDELEFYINRKTLLVNVAGGEFFIVDEMLEDGHLPLAFGSITQAGIATKKLTSFLNFPPLLGHISYDGNSALKTQVLNTNPMTLEHFSQTVIGDVDFASMFGLSYSQCHKYVKSLKGELRVYADYKGPMLGLTQIKGLKHLRVDKFSQPTIDALAIVNKHLQGDLIDCKEELMEEGYKEYAKL